MRDHISKWLSVVEKDEGNALIVQDIPVSLIKSNRNQPRTVFDDDKLDELAATIRSHGLIQPIVVRRSGDQYELIAGERRLRAAIKLGMQTIPAITRQISDSQSASLALIENLQRENLTAIEEALAYQHFISEYHLTQESLAQRMSKSQSTIANKLRLLHLCPEVQEAVLYRKISERHARALLVLNVEVQKKILQEIINKELTVKQTEQRVDWLVTSRNHLTVPKRRFLSKDTRLAVNTIRQSLNMIEKSGFVFEKEENEDSEYVEFWIRLPKKVIN